LNHKETKLTSINGIISVLFKYCVQIV